MSTDRGVPRAVAQGRGTTHTLGEKSIRYGQLNVMQIRPLFLTLFIAQVNLKDTLAQQLLVAIVDITRIASVIERLDKTANDTDVGFCVAKKQLAAVACEI